MMSSKKGKAMWMEDLLSIADELLTKLEEQGVHITEEKKDQFFRDAEELLAPYSEGDYQNHN